MATENPPGDGAEGSSGPVRAATGRKRAATLELRAANRRSAAAAASEEGEAPVKTTKSAARASRIQASTTGQRQGPRARQKAAKAALGDALPETLADAAGPGQNADLGFDALTDRPVLSDTAHLLAPEAPPETAPPETAPPETVPPDDLPAAFDLATPDGPPVWEAAPPAPQSRRRDPAPEPEPAPLPELAPLQVQPSDADDSEDDAGPARRRLGPRAEKRAARAARATDAAHYVVAPTVNMAEMRPRHYGVIALFLLMVLLPTLSYSWYLWTKAADQYESNVGFGSRTEDAPATFDFLGALGGVSQSGSKDMDILYQYIVSQELVAKMDRELDLKAMFAKPAGDPLYAFKPGGTIEDLLAYWQRMVKVNYDNGTGLMTLQVYAFDPADAQKIAEMILVESTQIINDLSMTAQEDTTRYSKDAMTAAEKKLTDARLAVLDYQIKNGIVDPSTSIATQDSIIGNLNQQLATAQVELDMLAGTVGANDLRIATLNRKIDVINNRIAAEQAKVGGAGNSSAPGFAKLMQDFERLKVDLDFAQSAYQSALAAYNQAITDAQHKTRYLATYVAPTLAEASTAPNRPLAAFVVAIIGFLVWSITVLIYYALRDRR